MLKFKFKLKSIEYFKLEDDLDNSIRARIAPARHALS